MGRCDDPNVRRVAFGLLLVVIAVAAMQSLNLLLQKLQGGMGFNKPLFIIWFNHCWMVSNFALGFSLEIWRRKKEDASVAVSSIPGELFRTALTKKSWSVLKLLMISAVLATLYMLPNTAFCIALKILPQASADLLVTASQQSTFVFVYIFSVIILRQEKVSAKRLLFLCMCIAGAVMVLGGQWKEIPGKQHIEDVLLLITYPVGTAVFQLLFDYFTKGFAVPETLMLTGSLGLVNMLFLWPMFLIASYTGFETLPSPVGDQIGALLLSGLYATVANSAMMVGITVMSPLFMSMGLLLQLPVANIVLGMQAEVSLMTIAGCLVIVFGFVGWAWCEGSGAEQVNFKTLEPSSSDEEVEGLLTDKSGTEQEEEENCIEGDLKPQSVAHPAFAEVLESDDAV